MPSCYWIIFEDPKTGERWDEGSPYVGESEEDVERQMIINGCGGSPDDSTEDLRQHYREYFEDRLRDENDRWAADYEIEPAEGWIVDSHGFPVRQQEEDFA